MIKHITLKDTDFLFKKQVKTFKTTLIIIYINFIDYQTLVTRDEFLTAPFSPISDQYLARIVHAKKWKTVQSKRKHVRITGSFGYMATSFWNLRPYWQLYGLFLGVIPGVILTIQTSHVLILLVFYWSVLVEFGWQTATPTWNPPCQHTAAFVTWVPWRWRIFCWRGGRVRKRWISTAGFRAGCGSPTLKCPWTGTRRRGRFSWPLRAGIGNKSQNPRGFPGLELGIHF